MKTSSIEEQNSNHNVVMFPSSKNFKNEPFGMDTSYDPLYNLLNEHSNLLDDDLPDYSDDRFEPDFEHDQDADSYHSLELFMARNSNLVTQSPDDVLIKLVNDLVKDISNAKERIKFYLDEMEMFLPSRKK
jgi:hypothetical protein